MTPPTTRRHALAAGLAVAAASVGLGWALRRHVEPAPPDAGADGDAGPVDLWSLRFDRPDGGQLELAALRGRPLLVNFWATWCPPCVKEMTLLDRFQRERAAWRVVGLAVDSPAPVAEFLARTPVGFAIGLAGMEGVALSRSLGNVRGALPFSVAFDSRGAAIERRLGELSWETLEDWAQRIV